MWTTRCDIIHDKTEYGPYLEDIRQLLEDINVQYILGMVGIPPGDAHLMEQPL